MISFLNPLPSLPEYSGPYRVGSTEYEIPISEISSSSPGPDESITTIKFRIFYPAPESASSKESVPWLPNPQKQWTHAYSSFVGLSPRMAKLISLMPNFLNYITIPAVSNAPLLPKTTAKPRYPLAIFSHGLGGNCHAYSSICGSLASYGMVCVAPEHRDGSAPTSIIRKADGAISKAVPYQKYAHSPTEEILDSRNAQLRIRLWELDLLYTVLSNFNAGKSFSNYTAIGERIKSPSFYQALDLSPGQVTWAGHSFGAATITQFVKSIYYHQYLPSLKGTSQENKLRWQPLYTPATNSELVKQITPSSPVTLLDVWTMPMRSENTKWLWERPLPCYDGDSQSCTNAVGIMSTEFGKHPELLNRMKALLSPDPVATLQRLERQYDQSRSKYGSSPSNVANEPVLPAAMTKTPLAPPSISSSPSSSSLNLSLTDSTTTIASSRTSMTSFSTSMFPSISISKPMIPLYTIPSTLHLSQSDFGILFAGLFKFFTKTANDDPVKVIEMNIHAMLKTIQGGVHFDFDLQDFDLQKMGFVNV